MASSLGHNLICSDYLVFSCQDFGLVPADLGTDDAHLAHDCDPGACDPHSA